MRQRKREVHMFRITFDKDIVNESMSEVLEGGYSGDFCVIPGCDDNYAVLVQCTKNMDLKRT